MKKLEGRVNKEMKKRAAVLAAMILGIASLAGCGAKNTTTQPRSTEATILDEKNNSETGSSVTAQEESGSVSAQKTDKPVILVVSFGTSYNESRDITIGAIETAVADAYPEYEVRRAFTSQIIIDILEEREKLDIDNVEEAFERLAADGVTEVIVQPTHVMSGYEYDDLYEAVQEYAPQFDTIRMGAPLLTSDEDYDKVVKVLTTETEDYSNDNTAIVFMGHGTEHEANVTYENLQNKLTEAGYNNYFIGTVEAEPTLEDVVAAVKTGGYTKVVLEPLMIVAGDHANNDMAGDETDSWKSVFEAEGIEVECVLRGLGEFEEIRNIYIEHIKNAEDVMVEETDTQAVTNSETDTLTDGTYSIEVTSSSSMFNIVEAQLTVEGGKMTAVLTLSGTGYEKLYMGTGEEALNAPQEDYIFYVENSEGQYTYEVPVEALDTELNCAAWSIKKSEWYDRTIVFVSDTIKVK